MSEELIRNFYGESAFFVCNSFPFISFSDGVEMKDLGAVDVIQWKRKMLHGE